MSLQERLETIRSSPTPPDEESAKFKILAPILEGLGWDPYGPEVLVEHPVGGKGGGRVDFALKGPDDIVAVVEAKAPGSDLSSHVDQVMRYAFHEGVDICILTTGLEWWLYLPREPGPPSKCRFAVLSTQTNPLEQLVEDLSAFLGRENLVSGQAERRAKLVLKARLEAAQLNEEIPSIWKGMLQKPDDELIELLSKRVYEKLNLRPTTPQVVAALQGSPIPSADIPTSHDDAPTASEELVTGPSGLSWIPWKTPTAIVVWGQRYPVSTHVDTLRKLLDVLYDRHRDDFDRVLEIRGHTYPYAARDPQLLSKAARIYHYEPASSGYFFDINLDPEGIERRVVQFLECFGHRASDFEVLYD